MSSANLDLTKNKELSSKCSLKLMLFSSAFAACLYGGVAYWVNLDHGMSAALLAGITQAVASAVVTAASALLMQFFYFLPSKPIHQFLSATLGAGAVVLVFFISLHRFMGTPDILESILPSLIIGTPYFIWFAKQLEKQNKHNDVC